MIPKKQRTVWSNDGGILNTKTQASQENTAPTQPGSNKVKAVLKSVPSRRPGGEVSIPSNVSLHHRFISNKRTATRV